MQIRIISEADGYPLSALYSISVAESIGTIILSSARGIKGVLYKFRKSSCTERISGFIVRLQAESVAHFSRIFKLHFRYPPSDVRLKTLAS